MCGKTPLCFCQGKGGGLSGKRGGGCEPRRSLPGRLLWKTCRAGQRRPRRCPPPRPVPAARGMPHHRPGADRTYRRAGRDQPSPLRRGPRWRAERKGRRRRAVRHLPRPLGGRLGGGAAPRGRARGSGGPRRPAQPGPAHVAPRLKCRSQGSLLGKQLSW